MDATRIRALEGVYVHAAFVSTGPVSGLLIEELSVVGTAENNVSEPRRARNFGSGGFASAFFFRGDVVPGSPYPRVQDITLRSVKVYGTKGLPALLTGIRGKASIVDSSFDNCLDVGFTFNETAHFVGNRVTRSADNGVSLSRGNASVVCVANNFEACAFWAIWIGGYLATGSDDSFRDPSAPGPSNVTVIGNVGVNLGFGGVSAEGAPKNFVISGNSFSDLKRGPADLSEKGGDQRGIGIFVTGHPVAKPSDVTHYADGFVISNNTISDAALGGIVLRGARNGIVSGNLVLRAGSEFRKDGKTVVRAEENDQNFGIAADSAYSRSLSNVSIQHNVIIDDRDVAVTNYPIWMGDARNVTAANNVAIGTRNMLIESPHPTVTRATSERPSASGAAPGSHFFDLTLGKPVWSDGRNWVDAQGKAV
jgi:parallel beta-helix repeat protein